MDILQPKAEHLVKKGVNPKEILDICCYLKFFPAMYSLRQRLVMRAYKKLRNGPNQDFEVYQILGKESMNVFLNNSRAWHPDISVFAYRKMKETKRGAKDENVIQNYFSEMKKFSVPQILQTPTLIA